VWQGSSPLHPKLCNISCAGTQFAGHNFSRPRSKLSSPLRSSSASDEAERYSRRPKLSRELFDGGSSTRHHYRRIIIGVILRHYHAIFFTFWFKHLRHRPLILLAVSNIANQILYRPSKLIYLLNFYLLFVFLHNNIPLYLNLVRYTIAP